MNYKLIILFCFLALITFSAQSQLKMNYFVHKDVPNQYKFEKAEVKLHLSIKYINLLDYLPHDYVKDASQDYTNIIQDVLNRNRNVKFPGFPLLINEEGLTINSNSNIYFENNSQLILQPNALERYEILRLHNVNNVEIINPFIVGDKDLHRSSKGQWGMGIAIRGASENIGIYNAYISDCWGDGIYIGHLRKIAPNNIRIKNATINNTYRNGISITTGKNIEISNTLISNINYNGIKIEPSNSDATFVNIVLNNVHTFNNNDSGISLGGFSKMVNKSNAILELEIINPLDDGSKNGMFFGMISVRNKSSKAITGYIKIESPKWINNKESTFTKRKFYSNVPNVEFFNLKDKFKKDIEVRLRKDKEIVYR